jgi:hypothetical protein
MRDPIHTTECEVIYTHAYVHVDIPNTNTHACLARIPTFIPVHTYHAQACPTTTHSCEQAMYCTHMSVWSVELWASAAAMCCAPFAPMELYQMLYAEKNDTARVHSSRCTFPYIQPSARSYTPMHTCIRDTNIRACLARIPTYIPVHNAIVYTMHKRTPLLRTHTRRLCTALT